MASTDRETIAELRSQLAERDATILELTTPKPIKVGNMIMPTSDELTRLRAIVTQYHRVLRSDDPEFPREFADAFAYLAQTSRTDPGKFSVWSNVSWIDRATAWCGRQVTMKALVAAMLAHNDIAHTLNDARYPHDLSIGLIEGGHRLPSGHAWRALLNGSTLKPAGDIAYPAWSPGLQVGNR